jgi:hypothetical protein
MIDNFKKEQLSTLWKILFNTPFLFKKVKREHYPFGNRQVYIEEWYKCRIIHPVGIFVFIVCSIYFLLTVLYEVWIKGMIEQVWEFIDFFTLI